MDGCRQQGTDLLSLRPQNTDCDTAAVHPAEYIREDGWMDGWQRQKLLSLMTPKQG
jgi:hypothetical protein